MEGDGEGGGDDDDEYDENGEVLLGESPARVRPAVPVASLPPARAPKGKRGLTAEEEQEIEDDVAADRARVAAHAAAKRTRGPAKKKAKT